MDIIIIPIFRVVEGLHELICVICYQLSIHFMWLLLPLAADQNLGVRSGANALGQVKWTRLDFAFVSCPSCATPVFLPSVSHGQRSLLDYSPQGRQESEAT